MVPFLKEKNTLTLPLPYSVCETDAITNPTLFDVTTGRLKEINQNELNCEISAKFVLRKILKFLCMWLKFGEVGTQ